MNLLAIAFENFANNTSLHGISYIIHPSNHKIEKIFWILSVLISLIMTGGLIYKLVDENQKNPTVIYTNQSVINIQDIDFPAVTICLGLSYRTECDTAIEYDEIISMLKQGKLNIHNLSLHELKMLQVASLIIDDEFLYQTYPNLSISTDDFMEKLEIFHDLFPFGKHDFEQSIMENRWLDRYKMKALHVLANTANCFTFNSPSIEDIYHKKSMLYEFSKNKLYNISAINAFTMIKPTYITKYPQKTREKDDGLYIEYDFSSYCLLPNGSKENTNYLAGNILNWMSFGVIVKVHSPYEVISKSMYKFNLKYREFFTLVVTPKITKIDENLIDSPIEKRFCYMPNERELEFFKVYNKANCEHECLAQMTLDSCGCVQFFMARNNLTKICGIKDWKCFHKVEESFGEHKGVCKCYDPCEDTKYEVALKTAEKPFEKDRFIHKTLLAVKVQFAVDSVFAVSKKRSQTIFDFLSFVGGLLGLFAGFSVLTSIEVLYYFITFPVSEARRQKKGTKVYPMTKNFEVKKVKRVKTKWGGVLLYVKDMLQNSSIHSFNEIGSYEKNYLDRLAWIVLFAISMILTVYIVRNIYNEYKNFEIVIDYEGVPTKVENIPFPALTLVRDLEELDLETLDDRISHNYTEYDEELRDQYSVLVCSDLGYTYRIPPMRFETNHDLVDMLNLQTSYQYPWFEDRNATWNSFIDPPFTEIMTATLKGYTFNLMEQSKLINEDLVSKDLHYTYGPGTFDFPWKTSSSDGSGLRIEIKMERYKNFSYSYYCLMRNSMILHPPNELPLDIQQITIEAFTEYHILITPEIVKSDQGLISLDLSLRKCYFDGERKLKFFKVYTQKNCELECLSYVVNQKCGCVPYNHIRNSSVHVCDFFRFISCFTRYFSFFNVTEYDHLYAEHGVCNCLSPCNYVRYNYEIRKLGNYQCLKPIPLDQESIIIELRWKDSEYFGLIRHQLLNLVDFLAYAGGIFGLFAGFSVLSIVELFYFMTFRLVTDLIRNFSR